jgi:hypothetical protein
LNHCGSARAALAALPHLARRGGATRAARVCSREDAERELGAAKALGVTFIAIGEPDYPQRLQMIDDAPPLFAVRGNTAALSLPMVGIVGARNASAAGMRFAERLARDLGAAGFAVVSGLARGIDGAAHRASLGTGTIAALAGGHDQIYPPEHGSLAEAIVTEGALVSEMPMGCRHLTIENAIDFKNIRGNPTLYPKFHLAGTARAHRKRPRPGGFATPGRDLPQRAASRSVMTESIIAKRLSSVAAARRCRETHQRQTGCFTTNTTAAAAQTYGDAALRPTLRTLAREAGHHPYAEKPEHENGQRRQQR